MAMWVNVFHNENTKYLKLKSKGWVRFAIIDKTADGKYEEKTSTKIVNGALESIDIKEGQFEGNAIYTVKITLVDNDEKYIVDINPETGLGRNTVASLLAIKEYGHIMQLSLYETKNATDPTKPYGNIGIHYNGEQIRWAYTMSDKTDACGLPALWIKKEKGKELTDYYDRDMALVALLQDHIAWLPKAETLDAMPTWVESKVEASKDEEETITESDIVEVFGDEPKSKNTKTDISDRPF